jgi:hypothetical protein
MHESHLLHVESAAPSAAGGRAGAVGARRPTTRRCAKALLIASLVVVYWVYNGGKFRLD